MIDLEQYDFVLANLDPTIGREMKKTRPCLIISPNEMNKHLGTVIIAPITSTSKKYPTRIEFKTDVLFGWIVLDQIRTIDKKRIISKLDKANHIVIQNVKMILKESFVD